MRMRDIMFLVEQSEMLNYFDAVAMIASDDELYQGIVSYVRNFEGGVAADQALAARFVAILSRLPRERWHLPLYRGESPSHVETHDRGFHSWTTSPTIAASFAGEYRDGAVRRIDGPVRAMGLEDIFVSRHRQRPDESPSGQQGEVFVLDIDT